MNRKLVLILAAVLAPVFCAQARKTVYDRGYDLKVPDAIVAPKGTWMLGGNMGFGVSNMKDYQFLVVNGINSNMMNFSVYPQFCYHFADNQGVGFRLKYSRAYLAVDSANAAISEDMKFNIRNYSFLQHKYMGSAFYRYYKPFGKSGRVSAFFEGELSLGGSQRKVLDAHDVATRGAFESIFNVGLAGNVGLIFFFTPQFAIDLNLSLLEFNYGSNDQVINQVEKGNLTYGNANFLINLLSLSFGLNFYL